MPCVRVRVSLASVLDVFSKLPTSGVCEHNVVLHSGLANAAAAGGFSAFLWSCASSTLLRGLRAFTLGKKKKKKTSTRSWIVLLYKLKETL